MLRDGSGDRRSAPDGGQPAAREIAKVHKDRLLRARQSPLPSSAGDVQNS